ncbi:MAG: hypothetical protein A2X61_12810 [Ignavibacteria bacterium GWB2_35_12]|nr:MAG: hypothetical protein A2X63_03825 [Ignavibacteria bacterium GWA2_35_8]OGU41506.1 MAG: hypothetical protein A2X61_12810 [Ignavibacteria bacterium GWB2_35_12]OGU92993.1 MAG: hypothetical protein A2220_15735 [Ignavibacteria bacterium RIFOXYA2_FULL_35_10]OGV22980.1 MAG: hypothetical protein A2475_10280 [Ignavibacteria bacterium RIFOXYC2_FULL_35_21]
MAEAGLIIKIILGIYDFVRLLMPRIIKWIYPFKKDMLKFDIDDIYITNYQHYQKLSFIINFNDYSFKTIDLKMLRFHIDCSTQDIVEFEKSIFLKIEKMIEN